MMHARATGGDIAMAGVDLGGTPPPEAKAAIAAEMGPVFKTDRRQYMKANYSAMSLAEAVRQLLPKAEVTAVAGTGLIPSEPTDIPAAVAAARNADVVILAVGGKSAWSNERTEGESSDTANKDLPPQQVELINAVTGLGKPTLAVVSMGGPYALASVIDKLPAVLTDYYGGPHQRRARSLTPSSASPTPGGNCPSQCRGTWGRCRSTWARNGAAATGGPRRTSTRAISTCRPRRCSRSATASATRRFEYGPLKLQNENVDVSSEARMSVTVKNTGKVRGTEVVQLYAADTATGVTLPAQHLIGFARVDLEPGAAKTVTFAVPISLLAYTECPANSSWARSGRARSRQQLQRHSLERPRSPSRARRASSAAASAHSFRSRRSAPEEQRKAVMRSPFRCSFDGRALAIIRPTGNGSIEVNMSAKECPDVVITIDAKRTK